MTDLEKGTNTAFDAPNDPFATPVTIEDGSSDTANLLNNNNNSSSSSSSSPLVAKIKEIFAYFVERRGCPCKHPITGFFHLFFKISCIIIYQLANWLTSNFVFAFVVCVVLLAMDFWTVKNITGRLMVGLRWWNEVKEDGTNVWRYESKEDRSTIDTVDSYIFWFGLYLFPIVWVLMAVFILFWSWKFEWFIVVGFALILSLSNCYGYTKCLGDVKSKVTSFMVQSYVSHLASSLTNRQ